MYTFLNVYKRVSQQQINALSKWGLKIIINKNYYGD